jgi:hypothetical protein
MNMKDKMNSRSAFTLGLCLTALVVFTSCEKEFDSPRGLNLAIGDTLTIADLAQIYQDSGTYKFKKDFTFWATVTADKIGGNFYKNVFCEDSSAAVNMRTIADGGLYVGDYFRVNLKGSTVSRYAGLLQLDSVDVDTQVIIQATGQYIEPRVVTINELESNSNLIGRIVAIENLEFVDGDIGNTFANPDGTSAQNRTVRDCDGNTILVRTSDFAAFAGTPVPSGNGTLVAIASVFNSDYQMLVRQPRELSFDSLRCDGSTGEYLLVKNFEDLSMTSGGWTQQVVVGSDSWFVDDFGGNNFAKATNYNGSGNDPSEVWLISPALDLTGTTNPTLRFMTMMNFAGPQLETYVSTDYASLNDVESATWNLVQANYSPGGYAETLSGPIDMTNFISSSTTVAFRYTGTGSNGSTWEVDDIYVFDN